MNIPTPPSLLQKHTPHPPTPLTPMRVRPMGTRHLDVGKEGPEGVAAGDGVEGHEGRGGQEEAHRQRQHLPQDLGAGHTGNTGNGAGGWGRGRGGNKKESAAAGGGTPAGEPRGIGPPTWIRGVQIRGGRGHIQVTAPGCDHTIASRRGFTRLFFWSHLTVLSLARHWGGDGNQSVTPSPGDPSRFPFERGKKRRKFGAGFQISSSPPPLPRREVPEPGDFVTSR